MLVGLRKTSPSEVTGKATGNAPAANTPRLTASRSSGKCRWQLLKPLAVSQIPTIGLSSAASVYPIDLANDRRRKRAKSGSP